MPRNKKAEFLRQLKIKAEDLRAPGVKGEGFLADFGWRMAVKAYCDGPTIELPLRHVLKMSAIIIIG